MKTKEKIIAIIPARGGSKSIPRKNILPLMGKPLVAWPIELALSVKRIDRVIISSEDMEIMAVGKKYGAEVLFQRPVDLAKDETTTLPVLQHCISYLEQQEKYKPDIVLLLYSTAPLLKKKRVEQALDLFEKTGCNSVLSVVKDWGRFWRKGQNGKYCPLHPKERVNRQYYHPLYKEDGAIYFSRRDIIMENNKMIDDNNVEFIIMNKDENIDIDDTHDLKQIQKL